MFAIPVSVEDPDMTGMILEYMAYESERLLLPAVYETTIKTKRMQDTPPADLNKAQEAARDAQKLLSDLEDYEKEMRKIQKDAAERDKLEKDIRVKFAKAKTEYDKQKVEYEAAYKEQLKELDKKRKEAEEKTEGLEPALLEKYRAIKLHCTPPVAKLYSGQCMGCNMSLPQATLRKMKNESGIIECENCGRMLIQM
jgi:predicted  nucleic acid-binding Zn-ribbon protein